MRRGFLGNCAARSRIDQRRRRIGKVADRIVARRTALGLDEDRPARSQPAQRAVEPRGVGDQFGGRCAVEVGASEACGALETAVLVEDDAGADQRCPGQEVGEPVGVVAIFARRSTSLRPDRCGKAQMPPRHIDELRIALAPPRPPAGGRWPRRRARPARAAGPARSRRQRAIGDGEAARRAAEQDMLGQRPVDRDGEAAAGSDAPSAIRPAPRRRTRRTTGRSSMRRRRSTGRRRSGSAGGSRPTCRRRRAPARSR